MNTGRTALILGGKTGRVGRAIIEACRISGWEVEATGRENLEFTAPDASDRLAAMLDRLEPSCVFNAVAYTDVDAAEEEEDKATFLNRTVPAMIGRLLKTRPCRLVHFSTGFVFNGRKKTPYVTEDAAEPLSVYGRTKLAGERAVLELQLPEFCIIRTAWLYGPGRGNFVRAILGRCREKRGVSVAHDQTGSPTYTLDLAQYTIKLVEAGTSGIFHIVNSGQASWCELASEAVSLAQVECAVHAVPTSAVPVKAVRPAYSVLDAGSLTQATGITPRPWPQALREYISREFPPQ